MSTPMTPTDIITFWDKYAEGGIDASLTWVVNTYGDLKALEGDVPTLVSAARDREVDLIKFLGELDVYLTKEVRNDTVGISDDGGELRPSLSDETVGNEDSSPQESDGSDDSRADSETDN